MKHVLYILCLFITMWSCAEGPVTPEDVEEIITNGGTIWYTNYVEFFPPYIFTTYTDAGDTNQMRWEVPMSNAFELYTITNGTTFYCVGYFSVSNASNGWEAWQGAGTGYGYVSIWNNKWNMITNALALRIKIIINTLTSDPDSITP